MDFKPVRDGYSICFSMSKLVFHPTVHYRFTVADAVDVGVQIPLLSALSNGKGCAGSSKLLSSLSKLWAISVFSFIVYG